MKRLFLLIVVMTLLWSVAAVNGGIQEVHIEPNQPTNRDLITIVASGHWGGCGVGVEGSDFRVEDASAELDIFFWVGYYGGICPWSHSEVIGTLPAGSYNLTVYGYVHNPGQPYLLGDTYSISFNVVPGPLIEADIEIEPKTLNLRSKGKWLTCHIWLPEDYNVADIEPNSVRLENEPNAIYAEWIWFEDEEQVAMAKFDRSEVQEMLVEQEELGDVELTVSGELVDGSIFEGTDTIRVIDKGGKKK